VKLAVTVLAALPLMAAIDGVVTNQTTGKPQPGATVTLYMLDQNGMNSLESVKSGSDGAFAIDRAVQGPHLLQVAWDGVTYNHMLPPGRPTTGLSVQVWNSSKTRPPGAGVETHMILLEPDGTTLNVSESFIWRNAGKVSYNDPDGGTLRFQLPAGAGGKVRVMCTAPQGMPIERAAMKTAVANVYGVDFPIKPGETRIDISYSMPAAEGGRFQTKALHGGGPMRIVAPQGVTLKGEGVEALGQEPTTQATIYEAKSAALDVAIEGTGALRAETGEAGGEEEEGGAGIQQIRPRVYDRLIPVLALSGVILLLTLALVYRRSA
jgi:hypothetical protein